MRIQHNVTAMNAYRNYNTNTSAVAKNLEKLSSGYKINRAGDDAAGLAVSQKMRLQIAGLAQAQKNAKSGISLVQTAEGALTEVHDMLERMYTIAEQSANGTFDAETDRTQLQKELEQLRSEIDRIGKTANFNGIGLFAEYEGGTTTSSTSNTDALTAADITAPTSTAVSEDTAGAAGANAVYSFDLAGVAFAKDGTVSVSLGGKAYDVAVTKDMTADTFASALVTEINKDKPAGGTTSGEFTAAVDGTTKSKITLTAKNAGVDDAKATMQKAIEIKPQAAPAGTADTDAAKKYESTLTGDDGTNALAANDTITIGSKTYTLKSGGSAADELDSDTLTTFEDQINAAITKYNAETGEDFTAAYADGKVTFTVKDGKTPTAAPTFTITDNASKISAGAVTEVKDTSNENKSDAGKIWFAIGAEANDNNKLVLGTMHLGRGNMTLIPPEEGATNSVPAGDISGINIADQNDAWAALDEIKKATNAVSDMRGTLGATQNRLDHTIKNLSVMQENMQDAESVVRDTDIAEEMMAYTKNNILVQSAQAMLAQANQLPQGVLQLLG